MLKNKTEKEVSVRYNGIDITVEPGGMLDVIDFNIMSNLIPEVETHINRTHPGIFEHIAKPSHGLSDIQIDTKIAQLEKSLVSLQREHTALKDEYKSLSNQMTSKDEAIEALEKEIEGQKKIIGELKAKLKALK